MHTVIFIKFVARFLAFEDTDGQYANIAAISKDVKEVIPMQPLSGAGVLGPISTEIEPPPPFYSASDDDPPSYNLAARNSGGAAVAGHTQQDSRRQANNNDSKSVPLLTAAGTRGSRASSNGDLSDGRSMSPPPPLHAQQLPILDSQQQLHDGFQEHRV